MLKQFSFYKSYKNFIKQGSDGQVMITGMASDGDTLEELMDNAVVELEDWHGNEVPHCLLSDLADEDLRIVEADIKRIHALQYKQDNVKLPKLEWAEGE